MTHKRIIENELEGFGIRLNKKKPDIILKKKERVKHLQTQLDASVRFAWLWILVLARAEYRLPKLAALSRIWIKILLRAYWKNTKYRMRTSLSSCHFALLFVPIPQVYAPFCRYDATVDDLIDIAEGNRSNHQSSNTNSWIKTSVRPLNFFLRSVYPVFICDEQNRHHHYWGVGPPQWSAALRANLCWARVEFWPVVRVNLELPQHA